MLPECCTIIYSSEPASVILYTAHCTRHTVHSAVYHTLLGVRGRGTVLTSCHWTDWSCLLITPRSLLSLDGHSLLLSHNGQSCHAPGSTETRAAGTRSTPSAIQCEGDRIEELPTSEWTGTAEIVRQGPAPDGATVLGLQASDTPATVTAQISATLAPPAHRSTLSPTVEHTQRQVPQPSFSCPPAQQPSTHWSQAVPLWYSTLQLSLRLTSSSISTPSHLSTSPTTATTSSLSYLPTTPFLSSPPSAVLRPQPSPFNTRRWFNPTANRSPLLQGSFYFSNVLTDSHAQAIPPLKLSKCSCPPLPLLEHVARVLVGSTKEFGGSNPPVSRRDIEARPGPLSGFWLGGCIVPPLPPC